jgi:hypothetical protein
LNAELEEGVREGGGKREAELAEDVVPARPREPWPRFSCTIFAAQICRIRRHTTRNKNVQGTDRLRLSVLRY